MGVEQVDVGEIGRLAEGVIDGVDLTDDRGVHLNLVDGRRRLGRGDSAGCEEQDQGREKKHLCFSVKHVFASGVNVWLCRRPCVGNGSAGGGVRFKFLHGVRHSPLRDEFPELQNSAG